jgi:uncharacterized DUF497 family protein
VPLRIDRIVWTEASVDHVARHGVDPMEVEEVAFGVHAVQRAREDTYRLVGQTDAGRYLTVFLAPRDPGVYAVVTARDATIQERRAFHRR